MRVNSLTLTSFRGFGSATLVCDPSLTVLVGVNGAGKTSVLDALAVLLSQVHSSVATRLGRGPRFEDRDVQDGASFADCSIIARVSGNDVTWNVAHVRRGMPATRSSQFTGLRDVVDGLQRENAAGHWKLPLAVKYSVSRAPAVPRRIREHHEFKPLSAYEDALRGGGESFRQFFEWFREREDLENERRLTAIEGEGKQALLRRLRHEDPLLAAVRRAVARLMPGFTDLAVQRAPQRMVVKKNGVLFELEQLSDGERSLLSVAGDLARRLALANPDAADPLACEAVVMIDEVELHLHPGWQRVVVERLRTTFPGCQFILTTHSPQVLASVPTTSVRLLREFTIAKASGPIEGRDSNAILDDVMMAGVRPAKVARQLVEAGKLIDEAKYAEAKERLAELAMLLTEEDAEIVRLRTLVAFLEGSDAPHS